MTKYAAVNGTTFADEVIERWAAESEPDPGYTGDHIGPPVPGRPVSVGAKDTLFTLHLDEIRRAKLDEVAQQRQTTPSQPCG